MNLIGKEINGCYRISEKIGENIICRIYKMEGVFSPVQAIFKILKKQNFEYNIEELFRFKQKMKGIYNIKHPNITSVYEVDETDGSTYVIMEYVNGLTLKEFLQNKSVPGYNNILSLIINIARGMDAAHRNGVIHNNINLNNILIPVGGNYSHAKITNFGFSDLILNYHTREEDFLKNILCFLPPESCKIMKKDLDETSDLFSLGAVFYFLLTNKFPFKSDNIEEYFRKVIRDGLPAPSKLSSLKFPEILDRIIIKLLDADKKKRYQSAMSLIDDLEKILMNKTEFILGEDENNFDSNFEIDLVGREKEYKSLAGLFHDSEKSCGNICVISGIMGIGKHKLLDEFSKYVFSNCGIFIMVDPDCLQIKKPYGILRKIFDKYCEYLDKSGEIKLSSFLKKIRESENPSYQKVKNIFLHHDSGKNKNTNKEDFYQSAADFFLEFLCVGKTLVIAINDTGMLDKDSINILRFIEKKIKTKKILVIYSFDSDNKKNQFINRLRNDRTSKKINLEELNANNLKKITGNIFNDPGFKIPAPLFDFIYKQSGGIPYYVIEILRNLVNKEMIFPVMDRWEIDKNKIAGINWKTKKDIILGKVQLLKNIEIGIIYHALVIETEFTVDLLFSLLSNRDKSDIMAALDYLVSQEFLSKDFHGNENNYKINDKISAFIKKSVNTSLKNTIISQAAGYYENEFKKNKNINNLVLAANYYLRLKKKEKSYKLLMHLADDFVNNYGFAEGLGCYKKCIKLLDDINIKNKKKELKKINDIISGNLK